MCAHQWTKCALHALESLNDLCQVQTLELIHQLVEFYELIIEEINALQLHNTAGVHLGTKKSVPAILELVDGVAGALDLGHQAVQERLDVALALVWHSLLHSRV